MRSLEPDDLVAILGRNVLDSDECTDRTGGLTFDFRSDDDRYYGSSRAAGVSLIADSAGLITDVHFHSDGHEGFVGFAGTLPCDLRFDMGRDDARGLLGPPERSQPARHNAHLGPVEAWDRWVRGDDRLHVKYGHGETTIVVVTVFRDSGDTDGDVTI
jgi:hypothetical protein